MIDLDEAALLLRGWGDDARDVSVVFKSSDLALNAPRCEVLGADADLIAFRGEAGIDFEFSMRGCLADFGDAPDDKDRVESAIVFKRLNFDLFVMLLTV
jgi:hypothetical protein